MDEHASATGLRVERVDFPYRRSGRRAPDRPSVLTRSVVEAVQALAATLAVPAARIAAGGRSMGGRMCSMAVAEGLPTAGLVLVSYPLHPPGRPERPRVAHFPDVSVPCLFVSGTRDRFAARDELEAATAAIAGSVTHHWIAGADHGLGGTEEEVAAIVSDWLTTL